MRKALCLLLVMWLLTACATPPSPVDPSGPASPDPVDAPKDPPTMTLNLESLTLKSGETAMLSIDELSDAAEDAELQWSSTDPSVVILSAETTPATEDAQIQLTAYTPGEATVTVQLGELTAACTVTVTELTVVPISPFLELEIPLMSQARGIDCNESGSLFIYSTGYDSHNGDSALYICDLQGNSTILEATSCGSLSGNKYVYYTNPTHTESWGDTELWLYDHVAQTNTILLSDLENVMASCPKLLDDNTIGLVLSDGLCT